MKTSKDAVYSVSIKKQNARRYRLHQQLRKANIWYNARQRLIEAPEGEYPPFWN